MNMMMTTIANIPLPCTSEWKTAAEWVALGLKNLPKTKSGFIRKAKRDGWHFQGDTKFRKRNASGGGWEYHVSCLPEMALVEFKNRLLKNGASNLAALQAGADKENAVELAAQLPARRRRCMEARAEIIREIDRRAFARQTTQRKAILSLIADVELDLLHEGGIQQLDATLLKAAIDANDRGKGLSRSQIFAWKKSYTEEGISALAPKVTRKKAPMPKFLREFLRYYARPQKPTIAQALEKYQESLPEGAAVPSYDQIRRALKNLQGTSNHLLAFKGREGPLALKARLAFVSRSTDGMEPTTIYTADGKTFDSEVQHPIHGGPMKPEITSVLDVVTRKCVGWSVGLAENAENVVDALRRSCQTEGIPAIFYVDRGPGFKNLRLGDETTGLCNRLGITKTHSIPQNSQARGVIERFNGSVWNRLSKEYATYLGADMDREAAQRVHKATRKDLSKLIPWERFVEDVQQAIADYNDRPHSSLERYRDPETGKKRFATPNEAWAAFEQAGFSKFSVSPEESDDLFRPYVRRKTRRGLIEWNTNSYFCESLQSWDRQEVLIGYDIQDGSKVWVREVDELDGEEAPGRLITVAKFAGNERRYVPLSFEQAAQEKRVRQAVARIDKKRAQKLAETNQPLTIEGEYSIPMEIAPQAFSDVLPLHSEPEPKPLVAAMPEASKSASQTPAIPKRRTFNDDFELARFAIESPEKILASQRMVLVRLLQRPANRDRLEMRNIDYEQLLAVVRAIPVEGCDEGNSIPSPQTRENKA